MPSKIDSYRDLLVWRQAMELAVSTYETTNAWPRDELYGLTSQVRRAATSVPANIAELRRDLDGKAALPTGNSSR